MRRFDYSQLVVHLFFISIIFIHWLLVQGDATQSMLGSIFVALYFIWQKLDEILKAK